jgi:hypothetical protein
MHINFLALYATMRLMHCMSGLLDLADQGKSRRSSFFFTKHIRSSSYVFSSHTAYPFPSKQKRIAYPNYS